MLAQNKRGDCIIMEFEKCFLFAFQDEGPAVQVGDATWRKMSEADNWRLHICDPSPLPLGRSAECQVQQGNAGTRTWTEMKSNPTWV